MKPTQKSHTYRIPTITPAVLKCYKSVLAPRHQKSNFHPSKFLQAQPTTDTETAKTTIDSSLTMTGDIRPACNTGFASGGLTCKLGAKCF